MAKANKTIVKGVEDFSVRIFDNGFTLEYGGCNSDDEWINAKVVIIDVEELTSHITKISKMPKD